MAEQDSGVLGQAKGGRYHDHVAGVVARAERCEPQVTLYESRHRLWELGRRDAGSGLSKNGASTPVDRVMEQHLFHCSVSQQRTFSRLRA